MIKGNISPEQVLQYMDVKPAVQVQYFNQLKTITREDDIEISGWLDISEKTFRQYKKEPKEIKPSLIEHTILLISLYSHGIETFGTVQRFKSWLHTENPLLDFKKPLAFLRTISGIRFIQDRLTGIAYGDNA